MDNWQAEMLENNKRNAIEIERVKQSIEELQSILPQNTAKNLLEILKKENMWQMFTFFLKSDMIKKG